MRVALPLLLFATAALAVELPPRPNDPTSRYAGMMEQSPFALATVVEAAKEPTESFAANWEVTGLVKWRDKEGVEKDFVTIHSRDHRLSFTLSGDEESKEEDTKGVSLQSVDWKEESRKSTVMLKKGAELAKVEFGQETAPQAPPPGVGGPMGNQPRPGPMAVPGLNPGNRPNAIRPPAPVQPNVIRPPNGIQKPMQSANGLVIPSQPAAVYPQPPIMNNSVPANADPRRRVRVINSHP